MFKDRTVNKYYLTIVKGEVKEKSEVKAYLYKDEKTNKVIVSDSKRHDDYKEIRTAYVPVK